MVAPALSTISKRFHITDEVESQLTMSVFVLAYAIGPLFLGPMSEIYGRVIVLQAANLFYLVFNVACGVAQSKGQMIAFRFLSGLGGSAPLAVGLPLSDSNVFVVENITDLSRSVEEFSATASSRKNVARRFQCTVLRRCLVPRQVL